MIEVVCRGRRFARWEACSITASVERAVRAWQVDATDLLLPTNEPPGNQILMRPGDPVELRAGEDVILTGYLDRVEITAAADRVGIRLEGRSKTEDVFDCAPVSQRAWRQAWVEKIAAEICAPYDVDVVVEADTGPVVPRFRVHRDESAWAALDRLARSRGLLLTDDELGRLVITRAGAKGDGGALALGENVLESVGLFDASQLYSSYWCRGQPGAIGETDGALVAHAAAFADDATIYRDRVLEVPAEGRASRADCQRRATYEARVRAGRAASVEVTATGWRQADGTLWTPNTLVQYTDLVQGLFVSWLLVEATYSYDSSGEIARLKLAPPSGYELETPRERTRTASPTRRVGIWSEIEDRVAPPQTRPAKRWGS